MGTGRAVLLHEKMMGRPASPSKVVKGILNEESHYVFENIKRVLPELKELLLLLMIRI